VRGLQNDQIQMTMTTLQPAYTDEHRLFASAADEFVRRTVSPLVDEVDFDRELDSQTAAYVWDTLSGHGIMDEVPRLAGGEIDWVALGILLERLATADAGLAVMYVGNGIFRELLHDVLTPDQRTDFGHLFASGVSWAGAFSEAGAGSNIAELATTARQTADGWVIDGAKSWITGGHRARAVLVACRVTTGERTTRGIFLVDRQQSPFESRPVEMLGLRASGTSDLTFDGVQVPRNARLDSDGLGARRISHLLRTFSINPAIVSVGVGQHALNLALDYAAIRQQFGRPIAGYQLIQELLASMATEVSLARLMSHRVLTLFQVGADVPEMNLAGSMAKLFGTEMAFRAASACVQIHGANGLAEGAVPQRLLRDARTYMVAGGTSQMQSLIIGRALTGVSAFA
jgi:alkylation response protein AidB-like acyl-CoA dehydrogenase